MFDEREMDEMIVEAELFFNDVLEEFETTFKGVRNGEIYGQENTDIIPTGETAGGGRSEFEGAEQTYG